MAEVAARSRRDALDNPNAQLAWDRPVDELLAEPYLVAPLRTHDCPPITDGAAAVILAAGDRARELRERPAWIRGIDHRIEPHDPGLRDLTTSAVDRTGRGEQAGVADGTGRRGRAARPVQPPGAASCARRSGCGDRRRRSTRRAAPLAANPMMAAGLIRIGEVADRITDGAASRGVAHAVGGPCLQQNLVCRPGGRRLMAKERVAVVGIGQTKHQPPGGDVSIAGLVREAAHRALADAEMTLADIDAVVIGKAPDFFEGVMMPELYLADALGAVGQADLPGAHRRVGRRRRPPSSAATWSQAGRTSGCSWSASRSSPRARPCGRCRAAVPALHGRRRHFAPHIRSYIRRSSAPDHIGMLVALKDRQNALKNPYAHLHEHDISFDTIKESTMLWDPIRYLETCPSSDGACAIVLGSEEVGEGRRRSRRRGSRPTPCAPSRARSPGATR